MQAIGGWSEPSQVQKTLSKDILRVISLCITKSIIKGDHLLSLASHLVRMIKEGQKLNPTIFEALPVLLNHLLTLETIEGVEEVCSGGQVCEYLLDRLMSCKWNPQNLIGQILMFRDLDDGLVTPKRCQSIVDKVIVGLPGASEEETPALLYQLLLLGRAGGDEGGGCVQSMAAVFRGIVEYFDTLESMAMAATSTDTAFALRHSKLESQCVSHMVLALKHNRELSQEFLRYAKRLAKGRLPRFALMILLAISGSFKFAELVHVSGSDVHLLTHIRCRLLLGPM